MTSDPRTGTEAREAAADALMPLLTDLGGSAWAGLIVYDYADAVLAALAAVPARPDEGCSTACGPDFTGQHVHALDCHRTALPAVPAPTDEGRAAGHTIAWTIEPGYFPAPVVTCHEADGARCRSWCSEGCEEHCTGGDTREGGEHVWKPLTYCNVAEWLNNDGPADCYAGDAAPVRSGPIEAIWNGDSYDWTYTAAAVPASAPTGETREGRYRPCAGCDYVSRACEYARCPAVAAAAPVPAPATDGPPSAPTEGGPGLCANHWPTEEADCPTCGPQAPAEAACYRVNTPHVAHPWMVDGKTWQCPGIPASAPTGEGTDTPCPSCDTRHVQRRVYVQRNYCPPCDTEWWDEDPTLPPLAGTDTP